MTVAEMLGRISSRELSEWMAFYELEPFGDERADLRAGIVASTVANVNRDPKKGKAYSPQDFLPKFEGGAWAGRESGDEAPGWQKLLAKVRMLNAAFGGKEK